jgi:type IV secretory pathway VirB3-like protein
VKRSGRDEPMWVVIHMCMDAMLGIFLYSYLYLKLEKNTMSFLLYLMFSTKSENKRMEQVLPRSIWGGMVGEGGRCPKQCLHI